MSTPSKSERVVEERLRLDAVTRVFTALMASYGEHHDPPDINVISATVRSFHPITLHSICSPDLDISVTTALANGIKNGWGEMTVNDYLNTAKILDDDGLNHKGKPFLHPTLIASLRYFPEFVAYGDVRLEERACRIKERASQTMAVMKVIMHMYRNPHNLPDIDLWHEFLDTNDEWEEVPFIDDAKLRALILTSDYDRDTVVEIITTRSIFDADQIIDMLTTGGSAPLMKGTL